MKCLNLSKLILQILLLVLSYLTVITDKCEAQLNLNLQEAQRLASRLRKDNATKTQVRHLFGTLRQIEISWPRQTETEQEEQQRDDAYRELVLFGPRLAYQTERHGSLRGLAEMIQAGIKHVGKDRRRLQHRDDDGGLAYGGESGEVADLGPPGRDQGDQLGLERGARPPFAGRPECAKDFSAVRGGEPDGRFPDLAGQGPHLGLHRVHVAPGERRRGGEGAQAGFDPLELRVHDDGVGLGPVQELVLGP